MLIKDLMTPLEEIAMEETRRQDILDVLEARFGSAPNDLGVRLKSISDLARLRQLHRYAVTDPTLQLFLARL